jgi:hypothetical protein
MYSHPRSQRCPSSATPSSNSQNNEPHNNYIYGSTQEQSLSFEAVGKSDRDVFGASGVYGRESSLREVRMSIYYAGSR